MSNKSRKLPVMGFIPMRNEFKENIQSVYADPADQKILKIGWRQYKLGMFSFLIFNFSFLISFSQYITNSPYSRYGLGDMQNTSFVHNTAMGGIYNALQNDSTAPFFINASNPASHASTRLTVFEFGVRNSATKLETADKKFTSDKTSLSYMALAFPVAKWWGTSFGLLPYSNVGYKILDQKTQDSIGTMNYSYNGEGGINQVYWGNGFRIKKFYIGANISYLFGDLIYSSRDSFPATSISYNTRLSRTTRVSDMYYSFGMQFRQPLTHGWVLTLGATGSLKSNLNVKQNTFAALYQNAFGVEIVKDTLIHPNDVKSSITIPTMFGGGVVLKKGDKWLFGFDYSIQKWSQFNSFGQQGLLKDDRKMAFGMQFVPAKSAGTKEPYYKKIFYRAGFRYANSYLNLKDTPFNDYAITFGAGLPLRKNKIIGVTDGELEQKYYQSVINVGFEIGRRGTTVNQLILERYFNAFLSFTLNDKWFTKRKLD